MKQCFLQVCFNVVEELDGLSLGSVRGVELYGLRGSHFQCRFRFCGCKVKYKGEVEDSLSVVKSKQESGPPASYKVCFDSLPTCLQSHVRRWRGLHDVRDRTVTRFRLLVGYGSLDTGQCNAAGTFIKVPHSPPLNISGREINLGVEPEQAGLLNMTSNSSCSSRSGG